MKRIFLLLAVVAMTALQSCEGDQGPVGPQGPQGPGDGDTISEVFELQNVNFQLNANNEYTIYRELNPVIFDSDNILIYRMTGTIDAQTPIWQLIPRTLFLNEGELDYDFDFSMEDFTIYAGGTYNLATTPQFINNQTFRIVIVPGYFSRGGVNLEDYNAVIKAYGIDDSNVKILN
ncbi:MAG: hypothetical protein EOO46_11910 [Flavobacterium sp.]|nr:MAG: hypothetical protein EOO46_11910 [Flavobacterium sp.]